MIVRRNRDHDYGDELPMVGGHADAIAHPWDLLEDDCQRLEAELRERLARKRPPGFAPWPAVADEGNADTEPGEPQQRKPTPPAGEPT